MPPDLSDLSRQIESLSATIHEPIWKHWDFWLGVILGSASLYYSIRSFREAGQAKKAAIAAGRIVKLQTITVELAEIAQKLDRVQPEIYFNEARDLLAEISRRLRRAIAPFADDPIFKASVTAARESLISARDSMQKVRPSDATKEDETPNAVYNGVESEFANISNCVADLIGLFEMKSIEVGDNNANS